MSFGSTKYQEPDPPKLMGAQVALVATNENARPLPWFAGTRWLGVTWIGDVFSVVTTEIKQEVGKDEKTVGYNYFASFSALICNGIVSRVTQIKFNDEVVWSGNIVRGEEDFVSITIPTRGIVHLHWGTETQTIHPLLAGSGQQHSAYRGQCYLVGQRISFGANTTTAPNIQLELFRVAGPTWLPKWTIQQTAADVCLDANPMAVLWEWWTNKRFGFGRPESELDIPRIYAAWATLASESLGLSPFIDTETDRKTILLKLFESIDAYPTSYGGKLGVELVRPVTSNLQRVDKNATLGDPSINGQQWPDTMNLVRVKFNDYEKSGQDNTATRRDPANFRIVKTVKPMTVDRPWVTRFAVANRIAMAIGRVSALPQLQGNMSVRYGAAAGLQLGSVFEWMTRDGEVLILRVTERREPAHDKSNVSISFETDRGWANTQYFEPTADEIPISQIYTPEPLTYQIFDAPYAFTKDPLVPGLAYAVARGDLFTTKFDVYKAIAAIGPYVVASAHRSGGSFHTFAAKATLSVGYSASTDVIDRIVGISFTVSSVDQEVLDHEWDEAAALEHTLLAMFGETMTEVMSLFDVVKTGSNTYTAKTLRGLYDTRRRTHPIGTVIWLQARTGLVVDVWPPFTLDVRYYKLQPRFGQGTIELEDIDETTHSDNGRGVLPIAPVDVRSNGDGTHASWNAVDDIVISWRNTARSRTVFGQPFNIIAPTDMDSVEVQVRDLSDISTLDTFTVAAASGSTTKPASYFETLVGTATFILRLYSVRSGFKSLDHSDVRVSRDELTLVDGGLLLRSTDLTWHIVRVVQDGPLYSLSPDQDPYPEPGSALPYILLDSGDDSRHRFGLATVDGIVTIAVEQTRDGPIATVIPALPAPDATLHTLSLTLDDDDNVIYLLTQ